MATTPEERPGLAFRAPVEQRWFEDYVPGTSAEFGGVTVTEDDILTFARQYDPQPFHTDPEAAARTAYGGLIASGWHTVAVTMRVLVDHYLSRVASLGSPGIDELRWTRPVRPGDHLRVRVTVLEARPSRSKPDRGLVRSHIEVLNHHDEVVMTLTAMNLLRRRTPEASAP
jgi:acyl dehydratase